MIFSPPAWVTEPPQNTQLFYYGVGLADGNGVATIEKAKLKALQDLSSRLFLTVDSTQTETRSTTQKSTFFGSFKDTQVSESEIEISSYLSDIPGISTKKIEVEKGTVYCLVQLDRTVLQNYFWETLDSLLMEAEYLKKNRSRLYEDKMSSLRSKMNKAKNFRIPIFRFEVSYNELRYGPKPIPEGPGIDRQDLLNLRKNQ